jgi:hypothetical protein
VTAAAGQPLCQAIIGLCERADPSLGRGAAKQAIAEVRDRLREDVLRVAVGGRLNAGKSTLVNALLGEKLAATDATECTTKVTWFRFGLQNRIRLRLRDGGQVMLPLQPLGTAIEASGRPAGEIDSVQVESSNAILRRDYIIADTPGLDSLTGLDTESMTALGQADVLLYLMPHPGDNDREALSALRAAAAGAGISPVSTIGVLSRIDELGEGTGDPWPVARRLAIRYSGQLITLLSGVVPVAGLLAETSLGGSFTNADMRPLRLLAAADAGTLARALYTDHDFRQEAGLPIGAQERERLLSLLGMYGIGTALEELGRGADGAAQLLRALRARSGIDELLSRLHRQFVEVADQLRARQALHALDTAAWLGGTQEEKAALAALRTGLSAVRNDPRLRQLRLAEVLNDLNAGSWQAPAELAAQVAALATGRDLWTQLGIEPAPISQVGVLLGERVAAWRVLESNGPRPARENARTVREYLESLYFHLPRQ